MSDFEPFASEEEAADFVTAGFNAAAAREFIAEYAQSQGMSADEFMVKCALEAIEDAMDVADADKAYLEYLENPKTFTLEEVMKERGML